MRSRHRSRYLPLLGLRAAPELSRVVDLRGRPVTLPPSGLVMSKMLGDILGVRPGENVTVEVLEGARPVLEVPLAALVEDSLGLNAWMDLDAMHRLLREGETLSGAHLMVDPAGVQDLYRRVKGDVASSERSSDIRSSMRTLPVTRYQPLLRWSAPCSAPTPSVPRALMGRPSCHSSSTERLLSFSSVSSVKSPSSPSEALKVPSLPDSSVSSSPLSAEARLGQAAVSSR